MRIFAWISFGAILGRITASTPSGSCNNSPDLCARPYNSITHLGAHDSPFVRDASTGYSTSGNQYYNSTVQLSAGVRLLTAQVHSSNGQWHLCHSSCDLLDAGELSTWLGEISSWLDFNPNDVVTILLVNSDNASPTDLAAEFSASGITRYSYTPPSPSTPPATWPTLQQLIAANTRLLTFVASLDLSTLTSDSAYLMDEFTFIFENPFATTEASAFTCAPNRPTSVEDNIGAAISSNRMPFLNHFLYDSTLFNIEIPDVENITTTNSPGSNVGNLGFTASTCKSQYGRIPTFIIVDFFDQGPAISTIDSLNGVPDAIGRTSPPPRDSGTASRSQLAFEGVMQLTQEVKQGKMPSLGAWIWAAGDWTFGGINLNGGDVVG